MLSRGKKLYSLAMCKADEDRQALLSKPSYNTTTKSERKPLLEPPVRAAADERCSTTSQSTAVSVFENESCDVAGEDTDEDEMESLFSQDSRDEYIPSPEESTDSDASTKVKRRTDRGQVKSTVTTEVIKISPATATPTNDEQFPKVCSGFRSNVKENEEIEVHDNNTKSTKKKNRRVWDKKYSCMYCKTLVCKLPRHLFLKHKNEELVKDVLKLSKGDSTRQQLLLEIRNKGNYAHNVNILTSENTDGVLITKKTPPKSFGEVNKKNYLPCDRCLGFFSKRYLYRHMRKCSGKQIQKPKSNRNIQSRCAMLIPSAIGIDETFVDKVMSKMANDSVLDEIRKDELIVKYGQNIFNKHGHEQHLHQYVSQKMRSLARFLICAKTVDPNIKSLTHMINKNHYPTCVSAIKNLGKFNQQKKTFQTPSIVLKTGHALRQCANILRGIHIFNDNEEGISVVDRFISYFELQWTNDASTHALRSIRENHWNKPKLLPVAEDVKTFYNYLKTNIRNLKTKLIENPTDKIWYKLAKFVLAHVVTFNRKRVGETQRLSIETYKKRCGASMDADIKSSLTSLEVKLAESLVRIETRGKLGRGVPILLTSEMQNSIDILLQFRCAAKINQENTFLFANKEGGCQRASDALRTIAQAAKLKKPELMTSTGLRKHVGTMSQILNLSNNELDILANFMGHDIRVHRNFYRLSEDTLQMAKVSKILVAMEKGNISEFRGKNLDDIEIDIDDEITVEVEEDTEDLFFGEEDGNDVAITPITPGKTVPTRTLHATKEPRPSRKASQKQPWTTDEKNAVFSFFYNEIGLKIVPKKDRCLSCISQNSKVLRDRSWRQIKFCVYNKIKSKDY